MNKSYACAFSVELAKKYGVNNAVFIQQIIEIANLSYPDRKWFTLDELSTIFPYWSRNVIRNITIDLVNKGIIVNSNGSKLKIKKLDNTLYFSLSNNYLQILNK